MDERKSNKLNDSKTEIYYHINTVYVKAKMRLNLLSPLKFKLDCHSLETMYKSFIIPAMEYAIQVWGDTYESDINKLEQIHVDGMQLVTGATARSNIANLYKETAWQYFLNSHYKYS